MDNVINITNSNC